MYNKKACFILLASLVLTSLFACGSGGNTANLNASTDSSGVQLESISVTPTNPEVANDTDIQFMATGIYSDNTTQDLTSTVTWSSEAVDALDVVSGDEVAQFTGFSSSTGDHSGSRYKPGYTKATHSGKARIKASWGSKSGATTITVTSATLISIAITPTNPSIVNGTSQQFIATGTFSDNTTQDLTTSVTWNSSSSDIAAVSNEDGSNGLATSVSAGSTTITATSGNISGSTSLDVTAATLVSIAVTPTNPNIALGATAQFTATGTYDNGSTQNLTTSVTWESSSTSVASISNAAGSKGLATPAATGSSTITAISGSVSGTATITVTSATLVSIAVTPTNPSIALGTTKQFAATGTYSDGSTQNLTTAVTWKSSSSSVAAISNAAGSKGLATPVATGSSTITAISGSVSGTAIITVTSATLVSIAVTPTNPSIALGTTKQFAATGTYSDGSTQNLTTAVTWKSSSSSVAAISNAAGSNGLATPVATGSSTITAISGGISGTATITVTGGGGAVTLVWDAPTTNTDGSYLNPATDISLYKIYYGNSSLTYTTVVNVTNPSTTTISKTLNLTAGTYYFTVTAVDASGQESSYSNEAMKTI
jgi:hypothetical protein